MYRSKHIRTDMGTEYKNKIFTEMARLLEIQHDFSTPYHHQTVGTIERNHRVLNAYLRTYLIDNRDDRNIYSKYFSFYFNTTPNAALNHKFSPFELVFGHSPNMPMNKFENIEPIYNVENYVNELKFRLQKLNTKVKEILESYKTRMKRAYDKSAREINVKVDDKIKIKNDAGHKLENTYKGPFIVTEDITLDKNHKYIVKSRKKL